MSINLTDGTSVKVSRVARWFLYGFAGTLLITNIRGIAGVVYSVV